MYHTGGHPKLWTLNVKEKSQLGLSGLGTPAPRSGAGAAVGTNPLPPSAADLTRDTAKLSLELSYPVCHTRPTALSPTLPYGTHGILVNCVQVQGHGGWPAGWHWARRAMLSTSDSELRSGHHPQCPAPGRRSPRPRHHRPTHVSRLLERPRSLAPQLPCPLTGPHPEPKAWAQLQAWPCPLAVEVGRFHSCPGLDPPGTALPSPLTPEAEGTWDDTAGESREHRPQGLSQGWGRSRDGSPQVLHSQGSRILQALTQVPEGLWGRREHASHGSFQSWGSLSAFSVTPRDTQTHTLLSHRQACAEASRPGQGPGGEVAWSVGERQGPSGVRGQGPPQGAQLPDAPSQRQPCAGPAPALPELHHLPVSQT